MPHENACKRQGLEVVRSLNYMHAPYARNVDATSD